LFLGVLVACIIRDARALAVARRFRLLLDAVILLIVYAVDHQWIVREYFALEEQGYHFASIVFHTPLSYLQLSVMFALLLLRIHLYDGGLFRMALRSKLLGGFGLISYALYMYHQAVNGVLHGFIFNQAPKVADLPQLAVSLLVIALAIGLATLSYFFLERPIRRLGQRIRFEKASTVLKAHQQPALGAAVAEPGTP
jgi:peptidoglycan/LPS O-acetylase OafA/YrhL